MSTEYKRLPQLYKQLWAIFDGVKNKNDIEQLRQVLVPKIEERGGELVDVHLKVREDFYEGPHGLRQLLEGSVAIRHFL